jgi:hypothetical protein
MPNSGRRALYFRLPGATLLGMDKTSPSTKRWMIVILIVAAIIVAVALAFNGDTEKAPDKKSSSMSSQTELALVR